MADNNDQFFNDVNAALGGDAPVEEPEGGIEKIEKFKVGDGEYTQDELEQLVGLGKIGREAEEKYQTKLDKVWPNFQRTVNEKKELEERLKAIEGQEVAKKAESGAELTPEELAAQARAEAKKLGIVTKDDLDTYFETQYAQRRAGEKLLDETNAIVKEATDLGKPKTTAADLLEFMQERGFRDPHDAYEIMFKDELKKWEKEQLASAKPSGLYTQSQSTAGGKSPAPVKITKDNLEQLVNESLQGGQGA